MTVKSSGGMHSALRRKRGLHISFSLLVNYQITESYGTFNCIGGKREREREV